MAGSPVVIALTEKNYLPSLPEAPVYQPYENEPLCLSVNPIAKWPMLRANKWPVADASANGFRQVLGVAFGKSTKVAWGNILTI